MTKSISEILYAEMFEMDYKLMLHIKELRESKGWSQRELSLKMGLTKGVVGNIESLLVPQKYSIHHLSLLALVFGYQSMAMLFNFPTPQLGWIRLTLQRTQAVKKDGSPSKWTEIKVIKIEPWVKQVGKGKKEDISSAKIDTKTSSENKSKTGSENLSKTEQKQLAIYNYLKLYPTQGYRDIAKALGLVTSTVQRHVDVLKEKKIIRHKGPNKGGTWEILKEL